MIDQKKHGRFEEIIRDLAARFVLTESAGDGLITITKVEADPKGEYTKIFVTVFPETSEERAVAFLKRRRSDFREFVSSNSKLFRIPFFDFVIDKGEKNRIKVEEASKNN
jgi:ribosome-binding factor A